MTLEQELKLLVITFVLSVVMVAGSIVVAAGMIAGLNYLGVV